MFEKFTPAPPDAIMGLTEAYRKDPNPNKVNLGVGVYKDATGNTPILSSVKEAEVRILSSEKSKTYLPIEGLPAFNDATQKLIFGADHEVVHSKRAATAQAPGGTGALRMAADTIAKLMKGSRVWLSNPTWPNHPSVFQAAGLEVKSYPYFDAKRNDIDFDAMIATLAEAPAGDVIVLHGACHNPTGVDLNPEQWRKVADVITDRKLLPLVDFAYQGFADGLMEDAVGLHTIVKSGVDMFVANSYSKNFGLYNERIGALTMIAQNEEAAQTLL